jgi:glycosyltransferase involved in cell wall biosynthesis
MKTLPSYSYVLITAARDEAEFIELTIRSVVAQAVRPVKWMIVSDGSTDGTDEIVLRYVADHPWIELVRISERNGRSFSGKARAVAAGYARIRALRVEYDAVGNLDADISVDAEYFGFLLSKLAADPELGVVGTPFKDPMIGTYNLRFVTANHVPGACQLFRRECFEGIGGYLPVRGGGVDYYALLRARMSGWKTRAFSEKISTHHRPIGTAEHNGLELMFRVGVKDYTLGGHPLWELVRVTYRLAKTPLLVGGLAVGAGYVWALLRRAERPLPPDVIAFHRREQLQRLRALLRLRPFIDGERPHDSLASVSRSAE